MKVLVIGGTRNLGPPLVGELIKEGHAVSILNRGVTPDDLPAEVARLRADRTDAVQMRRALAGLAFDCVVDMTLYRGEEAAAAVELFDGRVGRYVLISTGQVYLVRVGSKRPFAEEDYDGPLMEEPEPASEDHADWLYGAEKRRAEDALAEAWAARSFPYTSLRLPMVNSERDHYRRVYNYLLRLKDGGPLLVPEDARLPLRHVYGGDVVSAVTRLVGSDAGRGRAYNVSQDETVTLEEFLGLLAGSLGAEPRVVRVPRALLEERGLLPHCSPFSGRWMSELTSERGKRELGLTYTPLAAYVRRLADYYEANPPRGEVGYERRADELELAARYARSV